MPFEIHPWTWTGDAPFLGYQGVNPLDDQVQNVFLGKDANFPNDQILNDANDGSRALLSLYLTNPFGFFININNQGVHHPFQHPAWNIADHDGRTYHRNFNKLLRGLVGAPPMGNMTPEQSQMVSFWAQRISFLELLRFPTIDNSGNDPLFRDFVCGTNRQPQRNRERDGAFQHRTAMNELADQCGYTQQLQLQQLDVINKVLCTPQKRVFVFKGFGGLWSSFSDTQREWINVSAPQLADLGNCFGLPRAVGAPMPEAIQAEVFVHTHFSDAISNAEIQGIAEIVAG